MEYPPRIDHLLEKYWQTETTVEEERELKAYFAQHPETGGATAGYFLFLENEARTDAPDLGSVKEAVVVKPLWKRYLSIAASILLICVAIFSLQKISRDDQISVQHANIHEIEDPDEAYEQAKQALLLVASKMHASE